MKKHESIRVKIHASSSGRGFDSKNGVATTPLHLIINHKKQNVLPFVEMIIHFFSLIVKEHKTESEGQKAVYKIVIRLAYN